MLVFARERSSCDVSVDDDVILKEKINLKIERNENLLSSRFEISFILRTIRRYVSVNDEFQSYAFRMGG